MVLDRPPNTEASDALFTEQPAFMNCWSHHSLGFTVTWMVAIAGGLGSRLARRRLIERKISPFDTRTNSSTTFGTSPSGMCSSTSLLKTRSNLSWGNGIDVSLPCITAPDLIRSVQAGLALSADTDSSTPLARLFMFCRYCTTPHWPHPASRNVIYSSP